MESLLAVGTSVLLESRLEWYLTTFFDNYHEIHAFQLGVYAAVLLLALRAWGYRHTATGFVLALFAFTMGFPDVYDVCRKSGEACGSLPVQLHPWYFLTGLLAVGIVGPRVLHLARRTWGASGRDGPLGRLADVSSATEVAAEGRNTGSATRSAASGAPSATTADGDDTQ